MGRWASLMFFMAMGCAAEEQELFQPDDASLSSGLSSTTPSSDGKADDLSPLTTGSTGQDDTPAARAEAHPLTDALDACANDGLSAQAFEAAYAERACEEWSSCDGSECDTANQSRLQADEDCELVPEQACDCLEVAWECTASYGTSAELWVVLPAPSCFATYACD